jgi:hypothetical protein
MNSLFYIKANVAIRVRGISGPFLYTIAWLVYATNIREARSKYEAQVRKDHSDKQAENFSFEYIEQTGTIQ